MPKIYKYRKTTDKYTTHSLLGPENEQITELCTINGETFVSVPDGVKLPVQPTAITGSVINVDLTDDEKDKIRQASPHVRLINQRVVEKIRKRYDINDELKMLRIGLTAETSEYFAYCEECVAWGTAEKKKLGLVTSVTG